MSRPGRVDVFMFSKAVCHSLKVWPKRDKNRRPGTYYACHAKKQVMAYFLWKHTTIQDEVMDDLDKELEERSLKLKALEKSKLAVLRMKKNIYISKDQCFDCKAFQERVREMTGIDLHVSAFWASVLGVDQLGSSPSPIRILLVHIPGPVRLWNC
jgi:hypothetical protein